MENIETGEEPMLINYLATFYTHFGAMRFKQFCGNKGMSAKMAPVPRELSSSCGVCVRFEASCAPETAEHEDMECCYLIAPDGTFVKTGERQA